MSKGGVPSYFIYNRRTYFVFFHEAGRASSIRPLPLPYRIGLGDDIVYRSKYLKRALTPPRSHMQQSIVLTDLAAGCVSITQQVYARSSGMRRAGERRGCTRSRYSTAQAEI